MSNNEIRQRIAYLVQYGGIYPYERPRWLPWAAALVALEVATLVVLLLR